MKFIFSFSILLLSLSCYAQNLIVGAEGDSVTGPGSKLIFRGVKSHSDEISIFRFNRSDSSTDLRVNLADDYGQPGDRFVVGTTYFQDHVYYPHLVVQSNGKVGIGTEKFGSERLAVNGSIHSREVRVDLTNWPDYVFEKSYQLSDLNELEAFIVKYQHLPEIPSAKEVSANGINLGEMNAKLLKKIEELTLLLINQNKRLEKLEKQESIRENPIASGTKGIGIGVRKKQTN